MGTRSVLKYFLTCRDPGPVYLPKGFGDSIDIAPIFWPSWLSEKEVDFYTSKRELTGFTGALNYYRAFN